MKRSALLFVAFAVAGGLYGRATASIPSPGDPGVFWVGNLCAPWCVLAFLAGRAQRSGRLAAFAGALADVACVAGFYLPFLTLDPQRLGLPRSTPLSTVALTSLGDWLRFCAGWFAVAVAGGAAYGILGHLWRRSHLLAAGLAVAAPFVAEPALWVLRNGRYEGPSVIWIAEVAFGLAVAGCMVVLARGASSRPGSAARSTR